MHGVIRFYHSTQVRLLTEYWKGRKPSLVVSVIPNFNRALFAGMARAMPGVPLVTILTDMADYPPHFWIERQPQYLVCGTDHAYEQALQMGYPKDRVFRTSGMILNPRFYEPVTINRDRGTQCSGPRSHAAHGHADVWRRRFGKDARYCAPSE